MDLLYFIFSVSFSIFVCRALLKTASCDVCPLDKYLLLAECEVRKASYGPSFFSSLKRGSITCRTDRANEANKMFIIWLC